MSDPATLKHTPLESAHVACGARMVEFGGWFMPVQYSGIMEEHKAVRSASGMLSPARAVPQSTTPLERSRMSTIPARAQLSTALRR